MIKKFLVAAAFLSGASTASAAVYNDVVSGGPSGTTISAGTDFSFTHNILDNGFNPATMTVDAAEIILALSDPQNGNERVNASVDLTAFLQVVNNVPNGPLSASYTLNDATFNLISSLQTDGILNVTLRVLQQGQGPANVTFNSSTLNVSASDNPVDVPEPAMLGLLGLGVLGLAAGRRKTA